jgi:hypothetical protein
LVPCSWLRQQRAPTTEFTTTVTARIAITLTTTPTALGMFVAGFAGALTTSIPLLSRSRAGNAASGLFILPKP